MQEEYPLLHWRLGFALFTLIYTLSSHRKSRRINTSKVGSSSEAMARHFIEVPED
jgi:hypothetical protein